MLTIPKKPLLSALDRAASIAPPRGSMPILSNVLLSRVTTANGHFLRVAAQDLTISFSTLVECDGEIESVCVQAKQVADRVRAMPDGDVALSVSDSVLTVKSKTTKRSFKLHAIAGDDFPAIPAIDRTRRVDTIDASALAYVLSSVAHAICTDDSRIALNSALLESDGSRLRAVASDGHRLSLADFPCVKLAPGSMLVPLRSVIQLRKFLDGVTGEIERQIDGASLLVSHGDSTLGLKLVDARFPPYEQVIPAGLPHSLTCNRLRLIDALKAVQVATDNGKLGVKLAIAKTELTISAAGFEQGEGEDSLECDATGKAEIGVCARYAIEALLALGSESVSIAFGGELDPLLITDTSCADRHVVMLMRF